MTLSRAFKIAVIGAAVLGGSLTLPWAFCSSAIETYAIFHCGQRAYVEPVPQFFQDGTPTGFTPQDLIRSPGATDFPVIFWQFGFANRNVNTGFGTDGTAFANKAFNGNDNGYFPVDVLDAFNRFPGQGFPQGSVCLGSNNWANSGVDGCCDNTRLAAAFSYSNTYQGFAPYTYPNDDNILNPYFGFYLNNAGFPGYYSLASIQDYPTAVLLRLPNDAFFAVASVANANRGNNGDLTGPCNMTTPGTNNAACDVTQGEYQFSQITNGEPNQIPSEAGKNNVISWQTARPREVSGLDCSVVNCGGTSVPVRFQIDPIVIQSEERVCKTNNPSLDTADNTKTQDTTRAAGVCTTDLKRKWGGLVRYTLEMAPIVPGVNTDPNSGDLIHTSLTFGPPPAPIPGTTMTPPLDANGNPTGPIMIPAAGTMDIPIPSCWRARVDIGKPPEAVTPSAITCRKGQCGDVGISIRSLAKSGVTCFGNRDPLVSENISDAALRHAKGIYTITWETTAEFTVDGFDIFAVGPRGEKLVKSVACTECGTGFGAAYEETIRSSDLKAGRVDSFRIRMNSATPVTVEVPVR